jgi:glucose-6-phosphate 1-dehydrogenase
VIERLVLFGASGDLTGRFLLPALAALHAQARLPEAFEIRGGATRDWDDEAFRRFAAERLEEHASEMPRSLREALVGMLRYRPVDVSDADSVAALTGAFRSGDPEKPLAAYLALPQRIFGMAVANLARAGLPGGSRIALEKPFGEDVASAHELNQLLYRVLGDDAEKTVFRVDHVLGMAPVRNLIALRQADRVVETIWSAQHVAEVEVLWEETLALEGRAGFYDGAGAMKDVMQNHMMHVLSVVAMEPPASRGGDDLRGCKLDALRAVRSLAPEDLQRRTQRARYTAGHLSGTGGAADRAVPAYVEEDGVDPARGTETFAELLLELDTPRWTDTCFRLRAGKALARRRKEVILHLRPRDGRSLGDELRIGIDGPEDIALRLTGASADPGGELAPLTLASAPYRGDLPAYAHVLLDLLDGGTSLSVRGDEAEEAWRIVDPVLEAWRHTRVPMREYAAGSDGPPRL